MAKDASLHFEHYLPPAGGSTVTSPIDLGVNVVPFSDQWRQGRLRFEIPALPNATNASTNITLMLQDSVDGVTFANVDPPAQVVLPGVATNGVAAQVRDMALPPGLRGPIRLLLSVDVGGGDNTAGLIEAWWLNE